MKTRNVKPKQTLFSVEFFREFLARAPSLQAQNRPYPAMIGAYLKKYYKTKGQYQRLVSIDAHLRDDGVDQRLSYQELVDYVDLLFVQNAFIVENFVALKIEDNERFHTLEQYLVYSANLTCALIDYFLQYVHETLSETDLTTESETQLRAYTHQVTSIYGVVNKTVSQFESYLEKYQAKYNIRIVSDGWKFGIYQRQIDALFLHAQLLPALKNVNLKSLGTEGILQRLAIIRDANPAVPQFSIILRIMQAKHAFHITKNYKEALTLLTDAEALRQHYMAAGLVPNEHILKLKYSIKTHLLRYATGICYENPIDHLSDLQFALKVAFEFDAGMDTEMEDDSRENTQEPFRDLFEASLVIVAYRYNYVKRDGFEGLNEFLGYAKHLIALLEKSSTVKTREKLAVVIAAFKKNLENFTVSVDTKALSLEEERRDNEKKMLELIDKEKRYEELFPRLRDSFVEKRHKVNPPKKLAVPANRRVPPSEAETQLQPQPQPQPQLQPQPEKTYVQATVAEKCYQFFQNHPVHAHQELLDNAEPHETAEVIFCIGDEYRAKSYWAEALDWLEAALNAAELSARINQALIAGIELSLSLCKSDMEIELQFVAEQYAFSLQNRKSFIYGLGLQACRSKYTTLENVSEDEINLLGKKAFKELGKKGEGNSPITQERALLKQHVEILEEAIETSDQLFLQAENLAKQKHENFPLLPTVSDNPAAFYHQDHSDKTKAVERDEHRPEHKK